MDCLPLLARGRLETGSHVTVLYDPKARPRKDVTHMRMRIFITEVTCLINVLVV
jgi:hypothetical protein